jgi:hypothetical protein
VTAARSGALGSHTAADSRYGILTCRSKGPSCTTVIADLGPLPLMIATAPTGKRQLISVADALLVAQISLFDRPDLSEPSLDFNGDGHRIPTRSVSSSTTCFAIPPNPNQGP